MPSGIDSAELVSAYDCSQCISLAPGVSVSHYEGDDPRYAEHLASAVHGSERVAMVLDHTEEVLLCSDVQRGSEPPAGIARS